MPEALALSIQCFWLFRQFNQCRLLWISLPFTPSIPSIYPSIHPRHRHWLHHGLERDKEPTNENRKCKTEKKESGGKCYGFVCLFCSCCFWLALFDLTETGCEQGARRGISNLSIYIQTNQHKHRTRQDSTGQQNTTHYNTTRQHATVRYRNCAVQEVLILPKDVWDEKHCKDTRLPTIQNRQQYKTLTTIMIWYHNGGCGMWDVG